MSALEELPHSTGWRVYSEENGTFILTGRFDRGGNGRFVGNTVEEAAQKALKTHRRFEAMRKAEDRLYYARGILTSFDGMNDKKSLKLTSLAEELIPSLERELDGYRECP